MITPELVHALLNEIDSKSKEGIAPITSDMLEQSGHGAEVLEYLIAMKTGRIISGDIIRERLSGIPRKMTSIRLTYAGLRALRTGPEKAAVSSTQGR
ncbi:MAG TPA: hypothetical protein VI756_15975 [Blastocatellia bacterium]